MEKIFVTQSFMPPQAEYNAYLDRIWESKYLTNQGPLLKEFESSAKQYLGVDNFHFITNGTTALQLALRALDITEGEVITTPFSFVATTSAILWERCEPVFVDIEPRTFNLDPDKIEAAITPRTRAIMPVHVFGLPADVDRIEALARKHDLKVIYDAAHAFGSKHNGHSLLSYGDIATCSFHATKLFHTIEGGAVISRDKSVSDRLDLIKKFGFVGDDHLEVGINAKANEFQAAMGLTNLKYIDGIISKRRHLSSLYDQLLPPKLYRPPVSAADHNYIYYPVLFAAEADLIRVSEALQAQNVFPRRYFYPSLNRLPYVTASPCPVSEDIATRGLCLPLYDGLVEADAERIAGIVSGAL